MLLTNYIRSAWRNILRHKLFSIINILGLAMGLCVYVFANLLTDYEANHDRFFENAKRIYTVGMTIRPEANAGINEMNAVAPALLPLIREQIPELETSARTFLDEALFTIGEDSYYQKLRFADPEFLQIFDFEYIAGSASALENPLGMVLTENAANKYFGSLDPVGMTISVDHNTDFTVTAVIKDPPANTHLKTYFFEHAPFEVLVPIRAMNTLKNVDANSYWDEMHPTNLTYLLLEGDISQNDIKERLEAVYKQNFDQEMKQFSSGLFIQPLSDANLAHWRLIGLPVMSTIGLLGLLVLGVACVNYTNLAAAQSMKRTREIGIRKVHGAAKLQLWFQFIVESTLVTLLALAVAVSVLEFFIPFFNMMTGKALILDYMETLPWLVTTVLLVGLLSGSYPAYIISKTDPIKSLRDTGLKGRSSIWIRSTMIALQFTISVCLLADALVVLSQNEKIEQSSQIFAKEQTYTLTGLDTPQIQDRYELLRREIRAIPGVESFSLSSQIPFEGTQHLILASTVNNDFEDAFSINVLYMDHEFLNTYDFKQLAGRSLTINDVRAAQSATFNVLINERAAHNLGFMDANQAIGNEFYSSGSTNEFTTYRIVGLVEDKNIMGLHNDIKPFVMFSANDGYVDASIKLSDNAPADVTEQIAQVWKQVIPEYPVQGRYLTETFQDLFGIFEAASLSLVIFAIFALILALIGLYGLSAFMAEQRIKEIGIRKVYGASSPQVVHLLVWQFSRPVIWSLPFALGLAYLASDAYLAFFAERIGLPYGTLLLAAVICVLLSWATVVGNSYAVARQNPIKALRYE